MTPEEMVQRLTEISTLNGVPFSRARDLSKHENNYGAYILRYKGYVALARAFECFFLETAELLGESISSKRAVDSTWEYRMFLQRIVVRFQSLRASQAVAILGYPYSGYALLRNIFDDMVLTSAVLQGFTNFSKIEGVPSGGEINEKAVKRDRKRAEHEVRLRFTGAQSGLSAETMLQMSNWNDLFDHEVHGARLSRTESMQWIRGGGELHVSPAFNESSFGMHMNRYYEVGWMMHRMLPMAQNAGALFSEVWKKEWRILDTVFRETVESMTKSLGKPIGAAISEFVQTKFPFTEASVFPVSSDGAP